MWDTVGGKVAAWRQDAVVLRSQELKQLGLVEFIRS